MAKGKGFLAVIAATVGGFAAGVLLAPKSGKETRDELRAKAEAKRGEAKKKFDDASDLAKKGRKEAEAVAQNARAHAGEVFTDAKERAASLREETKTKVKES